MEGDKYSLSYWPITSLDMLSSRPHLVLLSTSQPMGYSTRGPLWAILYYLQGLMYCLPTRHTQLVLARGPSSSLQPWFSICRPLRADRLALSHMGISIYHFITLTHFWSTTWLLLLIFPGVSHVENRWLTTQSKVNMQPQNHLIFPAMG